jgi:NAD(P)-dependent dehydrogenase (short-subunit alcohol dehydrogenase family)
MNSTQVRKELDRSINKRVIYYPSFGHDGYALLRQGDPLPLGASECDWIVKKTPTKRLGSERIESAEKKAIDALKALVDQAGIRDRNSGYNDFDECLDRAEEIIAEADEVGTYGDRIDALVNNAVFCFHSFARSTSEVLNEDPEGMVLSSMKMDIFVAKEALRKFEEWLDQDAD